MLRVAIRADASVLLGTGHLRRCLSLARALAACGAEPVFLLRALDDVARGVLGDQPFAVHWLQGGGDGDAAQCARALSDTPPAWTVVDHYGLDQRWHDEVREQLGCRIAVIDDLADRPLGPDLLIDHNDPQAAQKYAGRLARQCKILAGPEFALLDPVYASAERYGFNLQVRSIGIFMGGTDPRGHCLIALRACREGLGFGGPIEIVCSRSSLSYQALAEECAKWPGTRLVDGLAALAEFFARHDLQIGAGGGATWERCCIGVPSIACLTAPNQLATLPRLAQLGALVWAREEGGLQASIAAGAEDLLRDPQGRRRLGETASRLVDGKGALRVAAVLACAAGAEFTPREAAAGDENLLLEWANDPVVRANAFNPDPVLARGHAEWFKARLADPVRCRIFILEAPNGIPAGQVRFEHRQEAWEIGYSVAPAFRAIGLGVGLLRAALSAFAGRAGECALVGRVKLDNDTSAKVFRRLGFAESTAQDERGPHRVFSLARAQR